jgi:hypothetical protein
VLVVAVVEEDGELLVDLVAQVVEVEVLMDHQITQSLEQQTQVVAVVDLQVMGHQEMVLQVDLESLLFVTQFKRELKHGTFC